MLRRTNLTGGLGAGGTGPSAPLLVLWPGVKNKIFYFLTPTPTNATFPCIPQLERIMPKGTIRNPGSIKTNSNRAIARVAAADKARSQRQAKAANEWDEYRSAGSATKSLRKTMTDVRSAKSAKRGMPTINKFRKDVKK